MPDTIEYTSVASAVVKNEASNSKDSTDSKLVLLEKARNELGEKPEWRDRDVQTLREMVKAELDLNCPTDDPFLLRFLRARKFDYDRAFALLRHYYTMRLNNSDLYDNFRPSAVMNVFNDNMQTMLAERDQQGRRVFLFRAGHWDPSHCTLDEVFRANQMCLESVIREEATQINGIVAVVDMANFGVHQAKYVRPAYTKTVISLIQDCFPARFKGFHFVNEPAIFDMIYTFVKPFLNEKIRDRVFFHGTDMESLHIHIPPEILPEELGGLQPPTDNSSFVKSLLARDDDFFNESLYGYAHKKEGTIQDGVVGNYYRKLSFD